MPMRDAPNDQDASGNNFGMETLIGYILLAGVLLSATLIIAGLLWNLVATGSFDVRYVIRGTNLTGFVASTVDSVVGGSTGPHTILNLGICVLLLTPFVRVLVSVFYFAIGERNWKFTVFTGVVLGILTYSLFLR